MEFVKIEKCVVHIRLKFPNNADKYSELIKYEIKNKLKKQIDKVNEVFRDYTDGLLKLHDVRFKILKDDTGAKRAMPEDVLEVYKKSTIRSKYFSMERIGKTKQKNLPKNHMALSNLSKIESGNKSG